MYRGIAAKKGMKLSDIITPLYRHKDTYAAKINGFEDTMVFRAFMSEDELLRPFTDDISDDDHQGA